MQKTIPFYQAHPLAASYFLRNNPGHDFNEEYLTELLHKILKEDFGFQYSFFTPSCTSALEMCAELLDIQTGDEVIIPSFTHVSTASPFVKKGAKITYADSLEQHPNIDISSITKLINPKTKALIVVHYAGDSCTMEAIKSLCNSKGIFLIEDAAHAFGSFYQCEDANQKAIGSFGDAACFSFHHSKNISSGEGGLLVINNTQWLSKAQELYQLGTNKQAFLEGKIERFEWTIPSSSYTMAYACKLLLYAQFLEWKTIIAERQKQFDYFKENLNQARVEMLQAIKESTSNGHIFGLCLKEAKLKKSFLAHMKNEQIEVLDHYFALHLSAFGKRYKSHHKLINAEKFHHQLIRLPIHGVFDESNCERIVKAVNSFNPV